MSNKIDIALERLNVILPLKRNQEACEPKIKRLHQLILCSFVTKGHGLSRQQMASYVDDISEAMQVLNGNDMVTLSASGELTGAYPFSAAEREHIVRVDGHRLYAMCALDALAVAPMFQTGAQISSKCALTDEPVMINMLGEDILNLKETGDVHFGITWNATDTGSCCADSLCREMVFLKGEATAERWFA
ncbi:MAG: hypothetical protein JKY51_01115, partial [Opitutaceae bacterium]|nr:hypothetical protein [Opitutaceae bacterium]